MKVKKPNKQINSNCVHSYLQNINERLHVNLQTIAL